MNKQELDDMDYNKEINKLFMAASIKAERALTSNYMYSYEDSISSNLRQLYQIFSDLKFEVIKIIEKDLSSEQLIKKYD